MKKMFSSLQKSKILVPVIIVSFIILLTLFFFIPYITEKNTIDSIVRNAKNSVNQIKLTRAYYIDNVVKDIEKYAPNIEFDYDHQGINGKIPLPTTTIHDLSKIFSENTGLKFNLYSEFPFKNRKDRILTLTQQEAINYTKDNPDGMYVKKDIINGKHFLRVAVTDYMTSKECVDCHNNHNERTWEEGKWKLGDKRGVLEVIIPLDQELKANKETRNYILIFISLIMILLLIYYAIILVKREKVLLNENEQLEKRVNIEVENNLKRERQLEQQSRSSAMGEMMAAIIHQWKQPLNSISIANSAMGLHIELDDMDSEIFYRQTKVIDAQIEYMNDTMNDFKNFFISSPKTIYKLEECINNVIRLVGNVFETQEVKLKLDIEQGLKTEGYPNEINQVIINLLNNSRDAIEYNNSEIKNVIIKTYKEDDKVVMSITDFAGGIPDNIIDKIFEPYFTTKEDKKGTGIGLNMSKTIIEKVDGKISVANIEKEIEGKIHKGAEFKIKLKAV